MMILLALALLAADPDMTAANTPSAPPPAAKPADDMDKVVCHVDPETGTRLGAHKECHTKREWAQIQSENRNSLDQGTALAHPH